jgi:arginyl-tRNA synthetase
MSFRDFISEAKSIVLDSMEASGYERPADVEWLDPPDKSFGDLAFRVGFELSKKVGKKPGEIAAQIASESQRRLVRSKYVASITAHPSGFLNAKINLSIFAQNVLDAGASEGYGRIDLGSNKPILIEHTSVNPNKALHIGHLRNVALGDSLKRIFSYAGFRPCVLNYIDDSGLQVADIIVGFKFLGFPREPTSGEKFDHYAGDVVYVSVTKKYEVDAVLKEKQKQVLKSIELGDPEITKLRVEITDRILKEQLNTCWRFGATYDLLGYESDIIRSNLWSKFFEMLKEKGIAKYETEGKLAGCWIVTISGETEGEEKVLVRSDGTATYVAKDIPFAALKLGLIPDPFSYSRYVVQPDGRELWRTVIAGGESASPVPWGNPSLTVIDARQARLQRVIQHILSQFSGLDVASSYKHVSYAIVSLSSRTAGVLTAHSESEQLKGSEKSAVTMSGRQGIYVNADDAMEAVKGEALKETKKRNPDATDPKWFESVAEKIAISALRFSLLKQDLDKIIVFDLEDSLKLIGETGPYLLYTYARASSIISKLDSSKPVRASFEASVLSSSQEIELVKELSRFSLAVEKSAKNLAPKWIAHYSFSLCECFNSFYEAHRVLQETNPAIRLARIKLIETFRKVLASCLSLLGIEATERI